MKCQTIAQLTPPPPDPLLELWIAVIRLAERDARHPYTTTRQIEARRFLAELREQAQEWQVQR